MKPASNNQIKLLRKLAQRKHREKEGYFIVEGERAVEQVLANGLVEVKEVYINEALKAPFPIKNTPVFGLDEKLIHELSDTENPQGVLALCKIPEATNIEKLKSSEGLIIALDRIQDPGNLGTMIRTASWFGAQALLIGKGSVDPYNPKVVRSTAGATGSVPCLTGELSNLLTELESAAWQVCLLDGNPGAIKINHFELMGKTVLVVGNEANGLHPSLLTADRPRILIPSKTVAGSVESLNAAIALSIALYAFHK